MFEIPSRKKRFFSKTSYKEKRRDNFRETRVPQEESKQEVSEAFCPNRPAAFILWWRPHHLRTPSLQGIQFGENHTGCGGGIMATKCLPLMSFIKLLCKSQLQRVNLQKALLPSQWEKEVKEGGRKGGKGEEKGGRGEGREEGGRREGGKCLTEFQNGHYG